MENKLNRIQVIKNVQQVMFNIYAIQPLLENILIHTITIQDDDELRKVLVSLETALEALPPIVSQGLIKEDRRLEELDEIDELIAESLKIDVEND